MEIKYIRETQTALLEMAKIIDELCRRHNINYWISTGTVLGAVRNKGFIEWDDDLDMCFLIDDYYKVIKLLREEVIPNHSHYVLYNDHRPFPHYTEYLADTRIVRNNLYPVKVDLVKVKSLPNTPASIQEDKDRVNLMAFIYNKKDKLIIQDQKLVQKHLIEESFLFKRERYIKNFIKYVDGLNKVSKDHVYSNIYNDMFSTDEVQFFNYDELFPVKEIEFEGIQFYAPNNLEVYLTKLYGKDYINPPPKDQQTPYANKLSKSMFPPFISKALLWTLYGLKAVKSSFTLIPKAKEIKKNMKS